MKPYKAMGSAHGHEITCGCKQCWDVRYSIARENNESYGHGYYTGVKHRNEGGRDPGYDDPFEADGYRDGREGRAVNYPYDATRTRDDDWG